jgi:hypothetical protein
MHGAQRLARVGLVGFLVLTGCRPAPGGPGPQAAAQSRTPQTTGVPATPPELPPQVAFTDLSVFSEGEAGTWVVLGLARNDSRSALEGVVASVELLDSTDSPIAVATVPVAMSILQPGATSPFMARFEQAKAPDGARAGLQAFRLSSEPPARVSIDAVRSDQSSEGTLVLGSLRNRGPGPVQAREVIVVWRDADHALSGMALASVPQVRLQEDGTVPWLAEAPGAVPVSRLEVFAAVSAVDESSEGPLESVLEPLWRLSAQGHGFVAGAIRNPGRGPVLPEVAIAILVDDRLASIAILQSTVPLQPGETLAFAADRFPGLEAAPDPGDVSLELYLTGHRTDPGSPAVILLPASIQRFEVIGDRVFMQGTVANPGPAPLKTAMVFVSLRSTSGDPQTARWLALPPPQPGQSAEFFVDLPIAAGDDPAMSEYDLRAVGLPLPESSW